MQQQQHPSTAPASPATAKPGDHQILLDVTALDSTAPMHATGDVELLSDVRALSPEEQEDEHRVAAVGKLITQHFDVPDFRYVPRLGRRAVVVSVCELAQRGCVVRVGRTCDVTDATTGDLVGEGRRRGGCYCLDYLRVPPSS